MKAVTLLALPLLTGCMTSYSTPRIEVAGVRAGERTDQGSVVLFDLDITNVNEVELPLTECRYVVELDGAGAFEGVRSPESTLRRFGTQRVSLPAAFDTTPGSVLRYTIRGELSYTTPGEIAQILFDTGVRRPTVGFTAEGTVELEP